MNWGKMMSKSLVIILLMFKQFKEPYYQGAAAQVAFYYALSIVPILILVSQVLGSIFNESIQAAIGWIVEATGGFGSEEIEKFLSYRTATATNIAFLLVVIWSASKAQFSLMRIANYSYSGGENTGEGYIKDRLKAMLNMILTLIAVIFGLITLVYGESILRLILEIVGVEKQSGEIWLIIRWPIAFVLYFLTVLFNFYTMPSKKWKILYHVPGAIFSSLGILLVSFGYSAYVENVANYDILYGSLASMVGLLMWFYIIAWVLFFGILFNKSWDEYEVIETKKHS